MVTWEKGNPHPLTGNDAKWINESGFFFPARRKPEIEATSSNQAKAENQCHLSPSEATQEHQCCGWTPQSSWAISWLSHFRRDLYFGVLLYITSEIDEKKQFIIV